MLPFSPTISNHSTRAGSSIGDCRNRQRRALSRKVHIGDPLFWAVFFVLPLAGRPFLPTILLRVSYQIRIAYIRRARSDDLLHSVGIDERCL